MQIQDCSPHLRIFYQKYTNILNSTKSKFNDNCFTPLNLNINTNNFNKNTIKKNIQ